MKAIAVFLVALALPLSESSRRTFALDPGDVGPYAVGHTSFLILDTSRNTDATFGGRPLPVNVWYPADPSNVAGGVRWAEYPYDPVYGRWPSSLSSDWQQFGMTPAYEDIAPSSNGPFPMVLFSNGWGNRTFTYLFFAERLASHGFVVGIVQDFRDGYFSWDCSGTPCVRDPFERAMLNRGPDVSFMLDALLARNRDRGSVLFKSMRPDLIAAAGHSIGGYAALTLAGGDDAVCVGTTFDTNLLPDPCTSIGAVLPDSRIKAIVTLDASNRNLHFSELARITVPALTIGQPVETAGVFFPARQHAALSGRPNYRVDIRNALHQSFTNSCTGVRVGYLNGLVPEGNLKAQLRTPQCGCIDADPESKCAPALDQNEVNRLAAKYAIAFLKTHVVGDPRYLLTLISGWLGKDANAEFFVTEPVNPRALPTFRYFRHRGVISDPVLKDAQ